MDILDDTGASKLSAKVFSKVNYSFKSDHAHTSICFLFSVEDHRSGLSSSCARSLVNIISNPTLWCSENIGSNPTLG